MTTSFVSVIDVCQDIYLLKAVIEMALAIINVIKLRSSFRFDVLKCLVVRQNSVYPVLGIEYLSCGKSPC